ncbi:MAG TPA: hypothetical protein VME23_21705 [Terracidiphilus sp.]|nr:hypothetical protein [Terracidiphilus sp.]
MRLTPGAVAIAALVGALSGRCGLSAELSHPELPDIIATAAPSYRPLAALYGEERFSKGAQLLLVHGGSAEPLAPQLWASAEANVSFDGQRVLFAGKQHQADHWQIWEMTLRGRSLRLLFAGYDDAIRPMYLPSGQFVFARRTESGFQIVVAGTQSTEPFAPIDGKAGTKLLPITYLTASAIPDDVLADGRILFESYFPLGSGSTPEEFLVYADGSGVESYRCDHGRARWGGHQIASGDVIFTHGSSLARFTSPLAHEAPVAAPHADYAGAIAETPSGEWLVSSRAGANAHYVLRLIAPGVAPAQTLLSRNEVDLVEPVLVAPRTRPHRHPSGLHPWNYANMLALDSRLSREGDLKAAPASVRLETLDAQGRVVSNGTAPVETDGSFFVQVPGDRPIRFVLLDQHGTVVRRERGWFWIRGGEQRYCVGCHTGPERAAENRVPAVLMRTTTPFDLTGAKTATPAPASKGN